MEIEIFDQYGKLRPSSSFGDAELKRLSPARQVLLAKVRDAAQLTEESEAAIAQATAALTAAVAKRAAAFEALKKLKPPISAYAAWYDAAAGRNGEAWTAGMSSDRVLRLDIKTGEVAEYPLPRPTNIRRPYRRCEKPRHAMDRQQPRRIDRQGRTFGLTRAAEPLGGTVLPGSPTDFGKLIADETEKWAKVIRENNIKVE